MIEESEPPKNATKNKLWVGRLVLFFTVFGLIIWGIVANDIYTDNQVSFLKAKQPITKVELKIGSDSPATFLTILDHRLLDTINLAIQNAQEKDIQKGGAFETWADVNIYKNNKKENLVIQHSIQNGWMIEVGNKTLTSDYLFALVRRYSKQK